MEQISKNKSFGGVQEVYTHMAKTTNCEMTFAIYLPPQAREMKVPVLWYLSGLTCTHENAMTKAGLQQHAADVGMAIVFPDTSPRGKNIPDDEAYDLGQGAGFYLDATSGEWVKYFQMKSYIIHELFDLINSEFPVNDKHGLTGHSMGGHGALTLALNNPDQYCSVSAFAPIGNPSASDWGRKQFGAYLGDNETLWKTYDTCELIREKGWHGSILIDQGTDDQFIDLLRPEALSHALAQHRQPSLFRMQEGYDHSYFFVQTFAQDHVYFHAEEMALF